MNLYNWALGPQGPVWLGSTFDVSFWEAHKCLASTLRVCKRRVVKASVQGSIQEPCKLPTDYHQEKLPFRHSIILFAFQIGYCHLVLPCVCGFIFVKISNLLVGRYDTLSWVFKRIGMAGRTKLRRATKENPRNAYFPIRSISMPGKERRAFESQS